MITGSITLNNLTDSQLTQIMEERDKHPGKVIFPFNQVVQQQPNGLDSRIELIWNDESGLFAVIDIVNRILGRTAATSQTA